MGQFKPTIVIGCMEFSVMKLHAHVIGHAGMERLPSSFASVVFFTTRTLIHAIGQKMSMDVKSIVSKDNCQLLNFKFYLQFVVFICSVVQWWCKW